MRGCVCVSCEVLVYNGVAQEKSTSLRIHLNRFLSSESASYALCHCRLCIIPSWTDEDEYRLVSRLSNYSGTSEIRTPRDLAKVSLFRRCP